MSSSHEPPPQAYAAALAERTGWQQTSIGKRRGELMAAGLAKALTVFNMPVKRKAPSGSKAQVWEITEAGRAFLAERDET